MNLPVTAEERARVEEFRRKHRTGLVTLLFTDMVGSTKIKQALGDRDGVALIQNHHARVREILGQFQEGEEISTAGDSFFLVFVKPSDAVRFALLLQNKLRALGPDTVPAIRDRIGIHIGEVVIEEREGTAKPRDLYGIQVDTCARVMSLAQADQILLTRWAFDNARQVLKGEELAGLKELAWLNHGPYLIAGLEEPQEVCEVGELGLAHLQAPADAPKAQRKVSADEEPVLGWRPAVDQLVPHTQWVLEKKLGEGGFGEVWLGRHQKFKERRVFKFCFRADRVRSLKREMTLFRLLKERIGDHPNIVALREVYFDQPPFYVEMDYVEGQDLKSWCETQGGADKVPLQVKLEIVAQVADALQAAHDAGVIHRDVKPGNILVRCSSRRKEALISSAEVAPGMQEPPHVGCYNVAAKLTDFGIGQVVSEEYLKGVTRAGFTQTMLGSTSSQTGTQLYMAPELLAGKPATTRSDIYSLGVVLYQVLVGDFTRPITTDWQQEVSDPLLRDDLKHCFAGNPQDRFAGAGQLAKNLRALPERRAALAQQQAELAARERAAYRRGIVRTASLATVIVALVTGLAVVALHQSRKAKATALRESHERQRAEKGEAEARRLLYGANLNLAQQAWEQNNIDGLRQLLEETQASADRGFEWYYWQRQTHLALKTLRGHLEPVRSVAFSPDGQRIVTGSWDQTAKVWEAASGRELLTLKGHTSWIRSVAFSPDGHRIVTGSDDQTAKVWEAASGRELLTLKGHSAAIYSVAFSPDGQRIVTGSLDQTAKVWEAASGRELLTLKGHNAWVGSVAFSPDGQRIVTGSGDQTAKVWEAASGRELLTLRGHTGSIWSVAFSPDGHRIVTGSSDQTAKVWEAASGRELLTLKGHNAWIGSVAFSPDGQRIVTGGWDRTARVWEAASGRELLTLKGHNAWIGSAAFSPDGQRIVTGSEDQTARVWQVARAREVAAWQAEERAAAQSLAGLQRERTAEQERQRRARAGDEGAIKRWLILAPIALATNQSGAQGLDLEQVEGEGRLQPRAGETSSIGNGELKWREVALDDYVIAFNAILGRVTPLSVAYAVCYIRSEAEQRGLQMLVGSDDEAKVYLNGKQVHKSPFARGFVADQDTVPDIALNAGLNVLVFKVVNESREWQGSIRFTDAQGNPVKGIKVSLTP
jgi:WD40 repeat protein/class 3 adenylate cyclase